MPAATTHVEFAKDVLRTLPQDRKQKITNSGMFYLGSQGPDLFFFSHYSYLPRSLKKYGDLMHREKVFETVHYLYERCKDDTDLYSYYCGFLCHYALDSLVHPIVYAFADKEAALTEGNPGIIHVRIEAEYDVWILHQRGKSIQNYDVYKWMIIGETSGMKLADVYHDLFQDVYDIDISKKDIIETEKYAVKATRALKPGKAKFKFAYGLESFVKMPRGITSMMLNEKETPTALNLEHKTFEDYSKPDHISNTSFPDAYGDAISLAHNLINEEPTNEKYQINFLGEPPDHKTRN